MIFKIFIYMYKYLQSWKEEAVVVVVVVNVIKKSQPQLLKGIVFILLWILFEWHSIIYFLTICLLLECFSVVRWIDWKLHTKNMSFSFHKCVYLYHLSWAAQNRIDQHTHRNIVWKHNFRMGKKRKYMYMYVYFWMQQSCCWVDPLHEQREKKKMEEDKIYLLHH